jgi:polyphosphate glucokinase
MNDNTSKLKIYVGDRPEDAAKQATCEIANSIRAAVAARGLCSIAFSGGESPTLLFTTLAQENIPWRAVHIFQADERVVAADDAHRNWQGLHANLLSKISIPYTNLHPMLSEITDLDNAVKSYTTELNTITGEPPVLDIIHLGLGDDGHTASLTPNDMDLEQQTNDVALSSEYQGYRRITLNYSCLKRARKIIWFITGTNKAPALHRLEIADATIPAGRLHHDHNIAYVDHAAATELSKNKNLRVLAIDVGGSHVKLMDNVHREHRQFDSGPELTAEKMFTQAQTLTKDWQYDVVSMGIPGPVRNNRLLGNPPNLGPGWANFNFHKAFGKPLILINDAAMQALGSYQGGRMLFLGLGTGLGSCLIDNQFIGSMELAHLPYHKGKTIEDYVGERGLQQFGKHKWREHVNKVITLLKAALLPDYVVLGGGNIRLLNDIPKYCRRGDNLNAFLGGFRLWEDNYYQQRELNIELNKGDE